MAAACGRGQALVVLIASAYYQCCAAPLDARLYMTCVLSRILCRIRLHVLLLFVEMSQYTLYYVPTPRAMCKVLDLSWLRPETVDLMSLF